ncbi:ELWxxDGT repeat protein [Flavobacterium sp.]
MKKLLLCFFLFFALKNHSQTINASELEINFSGDSYPQNFTKGITKMYFSADDGIHMQELWVYDTVTNTTHLVKDVGSGNSGLDNSIMMTIGDILYFSVNQGSQLWRSDGTETGTYLVKLVSSAPASNNTITALFNYNGNVVFDAYDPVNGKELWISDGTTAGTTLLKDIRPGAIGSNPNSFFICNGILYFVANDGISGNEIWKSDGTTAGTSILKNIDGTSNDSITSGFIVLGNAFYFYSYSSANGSELWKSDGTDQGTQLFKDIVPGINSSNFYLYGFGTPSYFIFTVESPTTIGRELWICDGTVAGTTLLKDINPSGNGIPQTAQFALFNNKIYFNAYNPTSGEELWVTDGTTAGTQMVKDIQPGTVSSNITKLTATNNYLVFSARVSAHTYPTPWRSDGTSSGTFELKDINLTTDSSGELFVGFNNRAFFGAGYNSSNGNELWSTDGTTANTSLFKDIYHRYSGIYNLSDVAKINNQIIYTSMTDYKPAQSNGTINGTSILSSSSAGSNVFPSYELSAFYTKAGNNVFFKALSSGNGYELWKTDGTTANTNMVKDIRLGSGSSLTNDLLFMKYNDIFYFKANDGINGEELWRSDGTDTGTYLLKDINSGSASALDNQTNVNINHLTYRNEILYAVLNGLLYFTAYDGTNNAIWRTDGTPAGTIKVVIVPQSGTATPFPRIINATSNKLFFYNGSKLWASDGTQAGTTEVMNLPLTGVIQYGKSIVFNDSLYFTGYSTTNQGTVFKTDGTAAGTVAVIQNIPNSYYFTSLKACAGYVYFTAGSSSGTYGEKLWRTDGTTLGSVLIEDLESNFFESFRGCNTCYQGNLLFSKKTDAKLWYINDSMNIPNFYNINLTNSENFSANEGIQEIAADTSNGLFFMGTKLYGGSELYHIDLESQLDTSDFSSSMDASSLIVVYPNPSDENITVATLDQSNVLKLDLFDILGKKIKNINNTNDLGVSEISNGIYILKVTTDKSVQTKKIVIKH